MKNNIHFLKRCTDSVKPFVLSASKYEWLRGLRQAQDERNQKITVRPELFEGLVQRSRSRIAKGFTLIELLVVMTIIAILLTIVTPRYFHSVSKAEEAVLLEDLVLIREALDKFNADKDKYPDTLEDLVSKKYLRAIPVDPITKSSTSWIIIPPASTEKGAVYNVKSGAAGTGRDGTAYADW